jgi:Na+-translocating ferredoxin:NAD+ oxidoreductase RnfE subunit
MGFFLAALAPGAFIALGILVAIIQWLHSRFQKQ